MKRFNVAIIGMGFIGKQHYDALRRVGGVHIRAICASPRSFAAVKEMYEADYVTDDWHQIIGDPEVDAVHVCTPNILHDEINLAAVKAGKHVYAEKPMSITTAGAVEVYEAAMAAGVAHGINYQYRMNAAVQEMKHRIAQNGRSLYVSGQYLQDSVARHDDYTPRRIPETSPARALLDIGVHWADTVSCVMGMPIKKVYAKMYTHYPVRIDPATGKEITVRSDDTTSVMVEFADGTPGSALFSKCMLGHKNDLRVVVSGEQSEITWMQEQCDRLYIGNRGIGNEELRMEAAIMDPEAAALLPLPVAGHAPGWMDAERNAIFAFYRSIRDGSYKTGAVPYATFQDGVMGNKFVDACLKSAQEDKWIEL